MIVSIDGEAGSGKSTTARLVAKKLGFQYIDTGITYRAVALDAIKKGIDLKNQESIEKLSADINIKIIGEKIFLNEEDVTKELKTEAIGEAASICSTYKLVRKNMVKIQRSMATNNVICEGRDIGTVVFPNADIKIYMTAKLEERANRRVKELERMGIKKSIAEVINELKKRDNRNSTREIDPLRIPNGAIIIDTTNLTIDEQVNKVIKIINETKI